MCIRKGLKLSARANDWKPNNNNSSRVENNHDTVWKIVPNISNNFPIILYSHHRAHSNRLDIVWIIRCSVGSFVLLSSIRFLLPQSRPAMLLFISNAHTHSELHSFILPLIHFAIVQNIDLNSHIHTAHTHSLTQYQSFRLYLRSNQSINQSKSIKKLFKWREKKIEKWNTFVYGVSNYSIKNENISGK